MAARDRLYEFWPDGLSDEMADLVSRIGNGLSLAGLLYQSDDGTLALFLPDVDVDIITETLHPDQAEWTAILTASDNPMLFKEDETGMRKPYVRKVQFALSGKVQQQIWARDNFCCQFCSVEMGFNGAMLTVDHFLPLAKDGTAHPDNLITACKNCNKSKADMHPEDWCKKIGRSYAGVVAYIKGANEDFFGDNLPV